MPIRTDIGVIQAHLRIGQCIVPHSVIMRCFAEAYLWNGIENERINN